MFLLLYIERCSLPPGREVPPSQIEYGSSWLGTVPGRKKVFVVQVFAILFLLMQMKQW